MRGALIAFAVTLLGAASAAIAQDIRWYDNYQTAREEARKANKPLLLEFRCAP